MAQNNRIIVSFTTAELLKHSLEDNGRMRLMKDNDQLVEGKEPYCRLLCDKINEAVPNRSSFRVVGTIKGNGNNEIKKGYVHCGHDTKTQIPVTFDMADFNIDQPLNFKVHVKCLTCMTPPGPQQAPAALQMAPIVAAAPTIEAAPIVPPLQIAINAPNLMTPLLERKSAQFTEIMTRVNAMCAAANSPEREYREIKEQYRRLFMNVWDNDDAEALPIEFPRPPLRQRSQSRERSRSPLRPRSHSHSPTPEPPAPVQNVRDYGVVLSQGMALRIRSQRLAKNPKKKKGSKS